MPLFDVKFRNTRAATVQERQIGGTSPIRVLMLNLKRSLPSRQYSSPNEPFEQTDGGAIFSVTAEVDGQRGDPGLSQGDGDSQHVLLGCAVGRDKTAPPCAVYGASKYAGMLWPSVAAKVVTRSTFMGHLI